MSFTKLRRGPGGTLLLPRNINTDKMYIFDLQSTKLPFAPVVISPILRLPLFAVRQHSRSDDSGGVVGYPEVEIPVMAVLTQGGRLRSVGAKEKRPETIPAALLEKFYNKLISSANGCALPTLQFDLWKVCHHKPAFFLCPW